MKHFAAICAFGLALAAPVSAQQTSDQDGRSLIEDGLRLFMEGLRQEMEPALDQLEGWAEGLEPALRDFSEHMGPALRGLLEEVEDWSRYEPPVILPNGDILLRRKPPGPLELQKPEPQNEVEL